MCIVLTSSVVKLNFKSLRREQFETYHGAWINSLGAIYWKARIGLFLSFFITVSAVRPITGIAYASTSCGGAPSFINKTSKLLGDRGTVPHPLNPHNLIFTTVSSRSWTVPRRTDPKCKIIFFEMIFGVFCLLVYTAMCRTRCYHIRISIKSKKTILEVKNVTYENDIRSMTP